MTDWRECLSRSSAPARIADPNAYAAAGPATTTSPIDGYHSTLREILVVATPAFLAAHPVVGPLFLSGIVATTEEYLRDLFGRIISICPVAQAHSAERQIHLGSAIWHGKGLLARGAFEGTSLASSHSIKKTIADFLHYQVQKQDRVWGVFDEFDKVCELRHGAVHSGATVPGKNAVRLKLTPVAGTPRLSVGYSEVQECAEVCTSLAVSLNLDLFEVIAERWAKEWRTYRYWSAKTEHEHFRDIWNVFFSDFDAVRALITSPLTMIKCKNALRREFP